MAESVFMEFILSWLIKMNALSNDFVLQKSLEMLIFFFSSLGDEQEI